MKFSKDDQMLILLYGDGTKVGLEKALSEMRAALQPDEKELARMTDSLLGKLSCLSERELQRLADTDE